MGIRLIHTETLRMKWFSDEEVPQYAILSHTWDHGREISFHEMSEISANPEHPAARKHGYAKIVETCRQAKRDNIEFAWVDVCCIDKTSSSELSEAINSMYRWYQQAEVCYVILSDFNMTLAPFEVVFPNCKWFTRGWCLQELLAPRRVEFFDARWHHTGSRADLKNLISKITGISKEVLVDNSLVDSLPVAYKLSWAAKRETTREEDNAYCLLGIFNISMPILYGEGTKAFTRFQEEIIKTSNDLSIFAFGRGLPKGSMVANFEAHSSQSYCDLFATSSKDFLSCRDLLPTGSYVHWNNAFSLTNKGVRFRRAELQVHVRHGLYSMPLNCRFSDIDSVRIYLRKVGPRLYVKYDNHDDILSNDEINLNGDETVYTIIEDEIYIVSKLSSLITPLLRQESQYAICVRSQTHNLYRALQVVQRATSSDRWDAARMKFLTQGDKSFGGYWKVFPGLARQINEDDGPHQTLSGHFYMLCGLTHSGNSLVPQAWVRLCSLEQWKGLEKTLGIITDLNDVLRLTRPAQPNDHITMGVGPSAITATATINLDTRDETLCYQLELNLRIG
ncbi:hypothetical protein NUW58_g122 [Xylaria curta]|uniref:Uncharacterized protein n=1 Tax=Xylaria curta TaxID=42375 RepID=A0ACC1PTR5_9PEZI|nr:hypothetical protein NUW58_g122 [Xylaria curta]